MRMPHYATLGTLFHPVSTVSNVGKYPRFTATTPKATLLVGDIFERSFENICRTDLQSRKTRSVIMFGNGVTYVTRFHHTRPTRESDALFNYVLPNSRMELLR